LAGNWLTALTLDGHGNLWTVGSGGITRFDGRSWAHYLVAGGGGDIAVTPNGDVWMAGAGTALYRFDGEGWWRYGPEDGLPTPGTTVCVAADQHGAVWASVVADNEPLPRYEVTRFDGRQWTSYDVGIGTYVKEIYADSRDRLWIGDERGLLVFDRDRWRRYSGNQFAGVFAIVEDGDGRHWFGGATEEFGFLWGSTWTFVRGVPAGIAPSALLLDSQGDLWMGSFYYRGLVRICRGDLPTAVGQTPDALVPSVCQLLPAYPNPFNSETHIRFSLERADRISLRVLGTSGQVVATLAQGDYGPGTHQLTWNGRDARGRSVGAGVYLCELAGGVRRVRKLALVR